jgi:hypothetical protein
MARDQKGTRARTLGVRIDEELAQGLRWFADGIREKESTAVRMILRDRLRAEGILTERKKKAAEK